MAESVKPAKAGEGLPDVGAVSEDVRALLESQRLALQLALSDRAALLRREQESRAEQEHVKAQAQLSARERTQAEADRRYQGPARYKVAIPGDRAQLVLLVRAHSPQEADGRYREVCGVRSSDHEVWVGGEHEEPPAPDRATGNLPVVKVA